MMMLRKFAMEKLSKQRTKDFNMNFLSRLTFLFYKLICSMIAILLLFIALGSLLVIPGILFVIAFLLNKHYQLAQILTKLLDSLIEKLECPYEDWKRDNF